MNQLQLIKCLINSSSLPFVVSLLLMCMCLGGVSAKAQVANSVALDSVHFNRVPDELEFALLKEFFEKTGGPKWTNSKNWLKGNSSKDFSSWHGVTVSNGDVVSISLEGNNLTGYVPASIYKLHRLQALSLANNPLALKDPKIQPYTTGTSEVNTSSISTQHHTGGMVRGLNLPVWALGVEGPSPQLVDWRTSPPTVSDINTGTASKTAAAGIALDDCGNLAFYALHTGIDSSNQLHLYAASGQRLTYLNMGLNSVSGNQELQVVRVPGTANEWYLIYSLRGSSVCLGNTAYCPAVVGYARVKFEIETGQLTIIIRDVNISNGNTYTQGKAVSRTVEGDPLRHYLYLAKRTSNTNTMSVHRYIIDENTISFERSSASFTAAYWSHTIAGSTVELSPDETKLAISNRNENLSEDIIVFTLSEMASLSPTPAVIEVSNLIVDPDHQRLSAPASIGELYLLNGFSCFRHIGTKLSYLEFSPNGRYLYAVGGGSSSTSHSHDTYLLQIDLESATPATANYRVRMQIQEGVGVSPTSCYGLSNSAAGENRHNIVHIGSSYDGKLYFTKLNDSRLFVLPHPNDPLPHSLVPVQVDLSTADHPNIQLGDSAKVQILPESIDGYNYLRFPSASSAFSITTPTVSIGEAVSITISDFNSQYQYEVNWGDGIIQQATAATMAHTYTASGTLEIRVKAVNTIGCPTLSSNLILVEGCTTIFYAEDFEDLQLEIMSDSKQHVLSASATSFSDAWLLTAEYSSLSKENGYLNGTLGVWRNRAAFAYQSPRQYSPATNISNDGTFTLEAFNWQHDLLNAVPNWVQVNTITKYSTYSYELENQDVLNTFSAALYDYGGHLPSANGINMRQHEMGFTSFEYADGKTTGNFNFGNDPLPTQYIYKVHTGNSNVAVIDAPVEQLRGIEKVDVIGYKLVKPFLFWTSIPSASKFDIEVQCVQRHPLHPDRTIITLKEAPLVGVWMGVIRINLVPQATVVPELDHTFAHTGSSSLKVTTEQAYTQSLLQLEPTKRYHINTWVSINNAQVLTPFLDQNLGIELLLKNENGQVLSTSLIKPSGPIIEGWQQLKGGFICPDSKAILEITFKPASHGPAWYDDLRLHPEDGNMKSYVYDLKDYKLRAILDEENFASLFFYDAEGNLHLVKKETTDGIKTITESVNYQVE